MSGSPGKAWRRRLLPGLRLQLAHGVAEHLDDFLRAAADPEGGGLPPFVEREFREFLTCGVLAHGFARLQCAGCAFERLVPEPRPAWPSWAPSVSRAAGPTAVTRPRGWTTPAAVDRR